MFDFTVIEKHDTCLDEWMWDHDFRTLSEKVSNIEDYSSSEFCEAFEEAIEDYLGSYMNYDEIDSDDLYDACCEEEFDEMVSTACDVVEKLYNMEDGDEYSELIEFLAEYDPFDPPFDDAKGKIEFYASILDMIEDDKSELLSQLKDMREDVDDDTGDAETIDDYIDFITSKM